MVELLVVLAIIGVLIALLMPAIQVVRQSAARTQCANNLHQLGISLRNYLSIKKTVPTALEMEGKLAPYFEQRNDSVLRCPVVESGTSYGYNTAVDRFLRSTDTTKIVAMDAVCITVPYRGSDTAGWNNYIRARHMRTMNVLFFDGHVDTYAPADLDPYDPGKSAEIIANYWEPTRGCKGDSDECAKGMSAMYYTTKDWTGDAVTRKETTVDLPFGGPTFFGKPYNIPITGTTASVPQPMWSMKMKGKIKADKTDTYYFWLSVDNEGYLYIDGKEVIHTIAGGAACGQYNFSPAIKMTAGKWVDFEVKETNYGGPSHMSVKWSNSGNPGVSSVIPVDNLSP